MTCYLLVTQQNKVQLRTAGSASTPRLNGIRGDKQNETELLDWLGTNSSDASAKARDMLPQVSLRDN